MLCDSPKRQQIIRSCQLSVVSCSRRIFDLRSSIFGPKFEVRRSKIDVAEPSWFTKACNLQNAFSRDREGART